MNPLTCDNSETNKERHLRVSGLLIAFHNPQFRLLWSSNTLASLGMATGMLAEGWLVLTLTDSPFWVGAAAGLRGLGMLAFGLIGGALTDRINRRKVLIIANLLGGGAACLLGILILVGEISLWHILILAPVQGALITVAAPSTLALTYDLVGKGRMLNAIAAIAASEVLTLIFSGFLVGTLIPTVGLEGCYLFIAVSLILAPLPLIFMHRLPQPDQPSAPLWRDALEGLRYASSDHSLRSLLLFSVLMEMFGFSYHILLPVVARDVLEVGVSGLGYLATAGGVGALAATLIIASLGDFRRKGLLVAVGGGGTGLFLILFALSPYFYMSMVLAGMIGMMLWIYDTNMVTLIQVLSTDTLRGRVAGLLTITWGLTPLGGFLGGVIATFMGAPFAIGVGGAILIANTLGVFRYIRRI